MSNNSACLCVAAEGLADRARCMVSRQERLPVVAIAVRVEGTLESQALGGGGSGQSDARKVRMKEPRHFEFWHRN